MTSSINEREDSATIGAILHKRPFKEKSEIIDLLTDRYGRISLFTGQRKVKGVPLFLETFSIGEWTLKEGRSFYFIEDYTPLKRYPLKGQYIWLAYYLNELLLRLFPPNIAEPHLFHLYQRALDDLLYAEGQKLPIQACEPSLRRVEITLLEALGVMPDLQNDWEGNPFRAEARYQYFADLGAFVLKGSLFAPQNSSPLFLGSDLIQVSKMEWQTPEGLLSVKHLMRLLISPLLEGRPLRSRQWFEALHR